MFRAIGVALLAVAIAGPAAAQCGPEPYGMAPGQYCAQRYESGLRDMMREEIARERWIRDHPQAVRREREAMQRIIDRARATEEHKRQRDMAREYMPVYPVVPH